MFEKAPPGENWEAKYIEVKKTIHKCISHSLFSELISLRDTLNKPRNKNALYLKSLCSFGLNDQSGVQETLITENDWRCLDLLGDSFLLTGDSENAFEVFMRLKNVRAAPSILRKISLIPNLSKEVIFELLNEVKLQMPTDELQKALLAYAKGNLYHKLEEYEVAYQCFVEANELIISHNGSHNMRWEDEHFRLMELNFQTFMYTTDNSNEYIPVFIVGMPRSGSSSYAYQLSKKYEITDCGELGLIPYLLTCHGWPKSALSEDTIIQIRERYLFEIRSLNIPTKYFIDKLPMNFRYIGLIKLIFPEALFVRLSKNRDSVLWSNYKTYFPSTGLLYSSSFRDINTTQQIEAAYDKLWKKSKVPGYINQNYDEFISSLNFSEELTQNLKCRNDSVSTSTTNTATLFKVKDTPTIEKANSHLHYQTFLPKFAS